MSLMSAECFGTAVKSKEGHRPKWERYWHCLGWRTANFEASKRRVYEVFLRRLDGSHAHSTTSQGAAVTVISVIGATVIQVWRGGRVRLRGPRSYLLDGFLLPNWKSKSRPDPRLRECQERGLGFVKVVASASPGRVPMRGKDGLART